MRDAARAARSATSSATMLSMWSAGSKALGFAREILMAWAFGTAPLVDAYRIGISLVTFLSHLFVGEATTGVLVPFLARRHASSQDGKEADAMVVLSAQGVLFVTAPIGLVLALWPEVVLAVVTPNLTPVVRAYAIRFLPIFGVSIPLYSLASILIMAQQAAGHFGPLGLRPVGQNLFVLCGVVLAYGTGLPWLLPLSFLVYYGTLTAVVDGGRAVRRLGGRAAVALRAGWEPFRQWVPIAGSLMLMRGSVMLERFFGSRLDPGSIAALDYARFISEVPMLLVAVPTGAVLLTMMSQPKRFSRQQGRKLTVILAGLVASSLFILILAEPITAIVFQRGGFDGDSVAATSSALKGLSYGAWAVAAGHIAARYLMARTATRPLLWAAILGFAANTILAVVLVPRFGLEGLAISSSGGAIVFAAGAFVGALRHHGSLPRSVH